MSNEGTLAVNITADLGLTAKRHGVLIRLYAYLTGGKPIWIEDETGEVSGTIAYLDAFGGTWCHAAWIFSYGHCVLLNDGTVDERSKSNFMKRWRKA